jgi:hypothetical protein
VFQAIDTVVVETIHDLETRAEVPQEEAFVSNRNPQPCLANGKVKQRRKNLIYEIYTRCKTVFDVMSSKSQPF